MTASATGQSTEPVSCRKCGKAVQGKFCSACGTAVDTSSDEGWSAVARQVAKGDGSALASTALAILREPVGAPVRLALDPAYGGHMKFYLTFVSAAFVAMFVAPQELSRLFLGLDASGDHSMVKRMMVLQALIVLFLTPVLYYFFRWRSREVRTPVSYFKLSLLTIAASNIAIVAAIAVLFLLYAGIVYLLPFDLPSDARSIEAALQSLLTVAAIGGLVYVAMIHVRFWRIHWIWPALALLTGQLLLEVVTLPILNALGAGTLGPLFK